VPLTGACDCGRGRAEMAAEVLPKRRQVLELELRRRTIKYRTVAGTCARRRVHRSDFPEGVAAPGQCGPSGAALAVYPTQYQLLPYQRTAELLAQVGGIPLSPGSVHCAVEMAGHRLKPMEQAIRDALITAPVAHADEAGVRVGTALHWLQELSTADLNAYLPIPSAAPMRSTPSACWSGLAASLGTTTGRLTSVISACTTSATPTTCASSSPWPQP